jgi:branched chain amino acid efflux pump
MSDDLGAAGVWLIIAAMAVVTYGMRAGGFFLMGYVPMTARVRAFLQALPGAVVVALVVPVAVNGGVAATAAVLAALAMMAWWRNDLVAVIAGVAAAALVRAVLM